MSLSFSRDRRRSDFRIASPKSGFTLIEVLIGTMLLATLAVSTLLGFRAHHRQWRAAEKRLEATLLADRILMELSHQTTGFPMQGTGIIDVERKWWWRTQIVGQPLVLGQAMWTVRFEILEDEENESRTLTTVEILRPNAELIASVGGK